MGAPETFGTANWEIVLNDKSNISTYGLVTKKALGGAAEILFPDKEIIEKFESVVLVGTAHKWFLLRSRKDVPISKKMKPFRFVAFLNRQSMFAPSGAMADIDRFDRSNLITSKLFAILCCPQSRMVKFEICICGPQRIPWEQSSTQDIVGLKYTARTKHSIMHGCLQEKAGPIFALTFIMLKVYPVEQMLHED